MKIGDLVIWNQGCYEIPGLVLETRPAKKLQIPEVSLSPVGLAALAIMPELSGPEWFHECELEVISESV